ncbi:MAG: lytic transglycosylase domain-containing protein [Minwuia sp.]|uniref:lytic transglycosylase domain-containing protein n=1 Tax=Minwuia sp. TaxID=2493630 RepID=UPI003A89AE5B
MHAFAAGLAGQLDDANQSLIVGKLALRDGYQAIGTAYPVVRAADGQGRVASAMAHAITRQESAFNQYAISRAGARGLMQLMPATAESVAASENVAYSLGRLTRDPAYNTRLGGAYLARQIADFDGYLPMAAAAYNAGPGRISQWVAANGEPRNGSVDPIDWIELIPFSETRNYVQRVLEGLQVYRIRLDGADDGPLLIARDIGLKGTYLCGGRSGRPC